jgi:hypothetical protein
LFSTNVGAQVSAYTFAQSTGTYTPITGGTVLATAAVSGNQFDSQVWTIAPGSFPFSFTFNGTGYTGCYISSNGFITFGTAAPSAFTTTPLSTTIASTGGKIAAWAGDLNTFGGVAGRTGEVRWETVGVAPNREVVIQLSNWSVNFNSGTTAKYSMDIQYRLGENGNVAIVYGNLGTIIGSPTASGTRQIGLGGATTADFNNRLNAVGLAFTSSTPGIANNSNQAFNIVTSPPGMPTNGLTYSWSAPLCQAPGGLALTALTSSSATFSWNAAATSNIGYEWELRTSGAPGSGATGLVSSGSGNVLTTSFTGLASNTNHLMYVRTNCDVNGFSAWSSGVAAFTGYCVASSTAATSFISNVVSAGATANISNPSGGHSVTGYGDFTAQAIQVDQGASFTLNISVNDDVEINVFIDWNNDLDFNDVGELVAQTSAYQPTTPSTFTTGNIAVSLSQPAGNYRMRIATDWNSGNPAACGVLARGEREDYTVTVLATPVCSGTVTGGTTNAPAATVCSGSSFTLNVTGATTGVLGLTYQWQSSPDGNEPWTDISGATGLTLTTSQTAATSYRRRITCTNSAEVAFSSVVAIGMSLPTECYCVPTYTFGKTAGDLISNISITGTTLSNNTGTAQTNPAYTFFTGAPNLTGEMSAGGTFTVNVSIGTWGNQVIRAWIDYNDNGVFESPSEVIGSTIVAPGQGFVAGGFAPATFPITLSCSPPLGVHRMRVRGVWQSGGQPTTANLDPCLNYNYGETEDYLVNITTALPCPAPSNLTSSATTNNTATFSWTVGCVETEWAVQYGAPGFDPLGTTGTTVTATTNTGYVLSGLAPLTTYDVYVAADCDANGNSTWVGPVSINTLCDGTPDGGTTTAPSATVCPGASFTLNVTGGSTGLGITYQWQTSPDGLDPWTNATGTGASFTTSQTGPTWYRRVTTCTGSGLSANSTPVQLTDSAPNTCYCEPIYTSGKTAGDLISNIEITGTTLANNTGTAPVNPAYTFFTGAPNLTGEMAAGGSYTVTISVGVWGSQVVRAWIDYNDNGVFEVSETIGSTIVAPGLGLAGPFPPATFPISLACNPPLGTHRMRVRSVWQSGGQPTTTNLDPCSTYGFGETEDYLVTITTAVPCPAVSGVAVTGGSVTTTSAGLSWNLGCTETEWDVVYGLPGFNPSTGGVFIDEVNALSTTITGLTPNTSYQAYVRADCSGNNTLASTWVGPVSFTTLALPPSNDNCSTATPITCGGVFGGTTIGATTSAGESAPGVWYTFVGNGANVTLATCGTTLDTYISVYTGDCGGPYTEVAFNDDFCAPGSQLTFSATTGVTYRILVRNFGTFTPAGSFNLNVNCVIPPANDDCANATPLTCGGTQAGSTDGATAGPGEAAPGVWYTIVGDGSTISVSNCGNASFDSVIEVYTGACGDQTLVTSNDDACGAQSTASWLSTTGVTYYVLVRGFSSFDSGSFTLTTLCQNLCTINQSGGTVNGPSNVCAGATFTLSASNQNVNNTYQWQRRTATQSWTNIPAANGPTLTTTQSVATDYRVRIGCSTAGTTSTTPSALLAVAMSPFATCYCTPTTGDNTGGDFIADFDLGAINNPSGVNFAAYTAYPAISYTTTVTRGGQFTGSFRVGTFANNNVGIWIDYNRNGIFETTEQVYVNTANLAANSVTNFTFTVPLTAGLGTTALRIRKNDPFESATGVIDPCAAYDFQETEDYVITIANGSANDARANATAVTAQAFPACSSISGNLANATPSEASGNDLWYRFTASSNAVRIQLTGSSNCLLELEDNAGNTVALENASNSNGNEILAVDNLTSGAQYWLAVRQVAPATPTTFAVCIQSLNPSTCDNGNSFASLCSTFKVDWTGASNYQLSFTEVASPNATYNATLTSGTSIALSNIPGLEHGRSYTVAVNSVFSVVDAGGNTSILTAAGAPNCTITIGNHPPVNLRAIDRHPAATRTIGAIIGTDIWVCGVSRWQWEFQLVDALNVDQEPSPRTFTTTTSSRFIRTTDIPNVAAGERFRVRVRPLFPNASAQSSFDLSNSFYLQIAGGLGMAEAGNDEAEVSDRVLMEVNTNDGISAALYPNPNNGEMVNLNLAGIDSDNVNVRIMDATGRIVWSNRFVVDGALNTIIAFDRPLTSGIYLVEMTFDSKVITERMMVTK